LKSPTSPRLEPEPDDSISIPLEMQPRSVELDPCSPVTELVDGICIVDNTELDPILMPIRDYDYGLIYLIILVIVGIIGGVVGGIVFVIRRKRK